VFVIPRVIEGEESIDISCTHIGAESEEGLDALAPRPSRSHMQRSPPAAPASVFVLLY